MSETVPQEAHFVGEPEADSGPLTISKLCDVIKANLLEDALKDRPSPNRELVLSPTAMDSHLEKVLEAKGGELRIVVKPFPKELYELVNGDPTANANQFAKAPQG